MQSEASIIGALTFVACMCASAASADFRPERDRYHRAEPEARGATGLLHTYDRGGERSARYEHWWQAFQGMFAGRRYEDLRQSRRDRQFDDYRDRGEPVQLSSSAAESSKVPEVRASGLPSMAAIVLGGVAIVLSRRVRRNGV